MRRVARHRPVVGEARRQVRDAQVEERGWRDRIVGVVIAVLSDVHGAIACSAGTKAQIDLRGKIIEIDCIGRVRTFLSAISTVGCATIDCGDSCGMAKLGPAIVDSRARTAASMPTEVKNGLLSRIRAAKPATCGAAIEVPDNSA